MGHERSVTLVLLSPTRAAQRERDFNFTTQAQNPTKLEREKAKEKPGEEKAAGRPDCSLSVLKGSL